MTEITCNSRRCYHNVNGMCIADKIEIVVESITNNIMCESFTTSEPKPEEVDEVDMNYVPLNKLTWA